MSEVVESVGLALTARGNACVEVVRDVGGAGAEGFLRVTTILASRKKKDIQFNVAVAFDDVLV